MENSKELLESISKRLDVLITLKLNESSENNSVSEGVEILTRFGIHPNDIAKILNTSANTVNVIKSRIKKGKKK